MPEEYTEHPQDHWRRETGATGDQSGQGTSGASGSGTSGDIDWAALVGATLGGTAAIIRAAEGTAAPKSAPTAPTYDPYAAQKKATGIPMWVYLAGGGALLRGSGRHPMASRG